MPNTPALVGKGMTALYARAAAASGADRRAVERVLAHHGRVAVGRRTKQQLDAVTALSGSGPAYVFYFLEAMVQAGVGDGPAARTRRCSWRSALSPARRSWRARRAIRREVLRERVHVQGRHDVCGHHLDGEDGVKAAFVKAMQAAREAGGGTRRRIRPVTRGISASA